MEPVVSALIGTSGLSASSFYGAFTPLAPIVVILVPVALGIAVLRKLIKGASKAKVKI